MQTRSERTPTQFYIPNTKTEIAISSTLAGIPERKLFRYGSEEEVALAVADAMLSVARTAIEARGGSMPAAPPTTAGIGGVINAILAGLHAAAERRR